MIKENIVFFKEFLAEFQNTGACFPTSRWAASALIKPMRRKREGQNILELGPGTGSVTIKILGDMLPDDHLTICEINPRFMTALKKKLAKNEDYLKHKDRIFFFQGAMQDLPEDMDKYDVIVCALPFLNFDLTTVQEIFSKLRRVGTDNAVMTYYQYIGLRKLGTSMASPERKQRLKEIDSFLDNVSRDHGKGRSRVWLNVLPIDIFTLQFAA